MLRLKDCWVENHLISITIFRSKKWQFEALRKMLTGEIFIRLILHYCEILNGSNVLLFRYLFITLAMNFRTVHEFHENSLNEIGNYIDGRNFRNLRLAWRILFDVFETAQEIKFSGWQWGMSERKKVASSSERLRKYFLDLKVIFLEL